MIANKVPKFFFCRIKSSNKHLHIQFTAVILLFLFLLTGVSARPEQDKVYLRIQKDISSKSDDLEVISIGGLVLKSNKFGHADLSSLKSDKNGSAVTIDLGGGFAFNWDVSLFLGLGISLGYNTDYDDAIAAYYPEAGAIWDITKKFGITVSAKRYYNLYEENEDLVMFGLVFRN